MSSLKNIFNDNTNGKIPVFGSIDEAVKDICGNDISVSGSLHAGGGDINDSVIISLSDGGRMFLKSNRSKGMDFFEAEALGLSAIADTGAISVPRVLCVGKEKDRGAFLLLEYIDSASKNRDYWEIFADELAAMHCSDTEAYVSGGRYGFIKDNYIGERKQYNTPCDSWIDFFREYRLMPRINEADSYFDKDIRRSIESFLDGLDRWLIEPDRPSLLHGDLWGGNVIAGNDGKAWLIDPAVYVGSAEADLAMTELFGGFSSEFYRHYMAAGLLEYGYEDRRDIYNLYHLLNHLVMFGRSYYGSVIRIIKHYAG